VIVIWGSYSRPGADLSFDGRELCSPGPSTLFTPKRGESTPERTLHGNASSFHRSRDWCFDHLDGEVISRQLDSITLEDHLMARMPTDAQESALLRGIPGDVACKWPFDLAGASDHLNFIKKLIAR